MHVVEILLPIFDQTGKKFPRSAFDRVRRDCTEHFGGVTAFMRAPAVGLWADSEGTVHRDDIAVFEVMTESLDEQWWREYRRQLESSFGQDSIVVRACEVRML
jgi:hypothetical protein